MSAESKSKWEFWAEVPPSCQPHLALSDDDMRPVLAQGWIRQGYLRLANHLDLQETRALHIEALLQKDSADKLSVRLTEWVS